MTSVAFGDVRRDPAFSEFFSMARRVIRTISVDAAGTELAMATDRRDAVYELDELRNIVAVGAGQRDREREPFPLDDYVMLAAKTGAIDW